MTITIYGLDCKSTRKARQWMNKNEIAYCERNIIKDPLTISELQEILRMTIDGTEDIIATRSKVYSEMNLDLDELSLLELLEIIQKQPRLLKSPIIKDEKKLLVGYNEEYIRQFLPRKTRKVEWLQWQMKNNFLLEN
ncbi:transcriptional regulator Spx [Robertmurraya massiliosenegalensis]|uniref:transcriptional regulator Spx n=1 Tax=Robertmurraya TaxID=2837507 RepID=UPI0039A75845